MFLDVLQAMKHMPQNLYIPVNGESLNEGGLFFLCIEGRQHTSSCILPQLVVILAIEIGAIVVVFFADAIFHDITGFHNLSGPFPKTDTIMLNLHHRVCQQFRQNGPMILTFVDSVTFL